MNTDEILATPEMAIQSFERVHGLFVVLHDLTAKLWPFLLPERFRHCSSYCQAVKKTRDWACHDFEIHGLRNEFARFPNGRFHLCHAGLLEWVVPVYLDNRLAWLLFAGQRRPQGRFEKLVRDTRTTPRPFTSRNAPPLVTEEHAEHILESLRQLRSRLLQWHENATRQLHGGDDLSLSEAELVAHRRRTIERYIYEHHTNDASMAGLARELRLSESRAIHLVKELFGRSYIKLVNEMRLRTAASFLRETSRPILDVCLASGFQDLSHFHRIFRRRFGVTPLSYRRARPA